MTKKMMVSVNVFSFTLVAWFVFSVLEVGAHNTFFTGEYSVINMFDIFF